MPNKRLGEFANAFRIVECPGEFVYLDFLVYSLQENLAIVISRIRLPRCNLPDVRDRIDQALQGIEPEKQQAFINQQMLN